MKNKFETYFEMDCQIFDKDNPNFTIVDDDGMIEWLFEHRFVPVVSEKLDKIIGLVTKPDIWRGNMLYGNIIFLDFEFSNFSFKNYKVTLDEDGDMICINYIVYD